MYLRTMLGAAIAVIAVGFVFVLESTGAGGGEVVFAAGVVAVAGGILLLAWRRVATTFDEIAGRARKLAREGTGSRLEVMPVAEAADAATALNQLADSVATRVETAGVETERLKAALNSSSDTVIAVDADGRITFANLAAETLLGRPGREMLGNPFAWVLADEQIAEALRASREEGRRLTTVTERPNRQFLSVITSPIVGGGAWSTLVVIQDLTEVRRVEQIRRDFIANVSHELRTPLAALKAVIETLEGGALEDPAVARDFLARADMEVDRLVQMVEELLELSRIESGDVLMADEDVDLNTVASNAAERLRRQAERGELRMELALATQPVIVRGDRVRLERAVLNLVHNAVKFTAEGGMVRVSVSAAGGEAAVVVQDTGIGIDAEDLPRVFERFYKTDRSRRAGGTGLGLAVVKHTVEAHRGRVWAQSEPERGSVFGLAIPLSSPASADEPKL